MASGYRVSPGRRRPVALLLALVAHVLVILALFWAAPGPPPPREVDSDPKTFSLYPAPADVKQPSPRASVARSASAAKAAPARAAAISPISPAQVPPPVPVPAATPMAMLPGGMELFDAGDIGKLGRGDDEDGEEEKSAAVYGPGDGPGGERLYDARLLNAPTWSQIAGYLPDRKPISGSAMIACRVGERNELENCRQLSESPPGTGFARALRLAAWQFRIIPPRIGKRRLSYWVRVRLTVSDLGPRQD